MSAEAADRQDLPAEDTVRLSAVHAAARLTSIARYRILSELGRGAMARVYLALDPNINRKVALKVLEPQGLLSAIDMDELRTRFLLEARAAGNLRHPSAVAIYDADHDPDSGISFIAMEWIDGQSLDLLLKQEAPVPTDRAIAIISQMAGALDAAHAQGLIHRDVKPANILLDKLGDAKLSDFGIAKAESLELTSTGQVLGTPYYMSPEQIRDEELDGRSDLFSLGVVLYQIVTGQQPFHAESLPALTHKILHTDPAPPGSLNSEIPEPLATTIVKALHKQPDKRFQTGLELTEALTRKEAPSMTSTVDLSHPSLHAQPEPDPSRVKKRSTRRILLETFLLLTMIVAVWISDSPVDAPPKVMTPGIFQPRPTPTPVEAVSGADKGPDTIPITYATLQISYTNRLKSAHMVVWIDGEAVLTKTLYGPRGFFKRAMGTALLESIPVSTGHHDVKVTIRGTAGKVEASNRAGTTFEEGQIRRLRVELIPPSYLKLAWK